MEIDIKINLEPNNINDVHSSHKWMCRIEMCLLSINFKIHPNKVQMSCSTLFS